MDLQVLRFFVTVAQEGSFTAASERLHYAQSNLSTRIRQMEEELGETLFYRNKRGVTLTAKGELFYEYANRILNMSEEAITAMRDMDHARGSLTIGAIEATALGDLPKLFANYHKEYPDVKLSLTTDLNDVFADKVLNREIDGAFVAESPQRTELEEIFIKKEKLVFVTSTQEQAPDLWELLKTVPIITFPEGSIFRRRLELLLASHGNLSPAQMIILNSLGAQLVNISSGLGIGYLPESITESYVAQGLMKKYELEDKDRLSELDITFIYRRDHIMDAAFRFFLERLK